jgi:mutator protein MutT
LGADLVEVAAGLIFRRGQLLITQRNVESHLGGLWEFPGGKRELGETFEQCLARELREELGIEVAVGELIEGLSHAYPEKTVRLNFYRCQLQSGEPKPLGCADFRWIHAGQLDEFSFPAADQRLLERLKTDSALWRAEKRKKRQ